MERLRPQPKRRRTVSARMRRLITYVWIAASLALPVAGAALVTQGAVSLTADEARTTYQVTSGDTLSAIALRYSVSVDDLVQANGLADPNVIFVGQELVIPYLEAVTGVVHTVQQGESLAIIARRYGVSTDEIMAANDLADLNSIFVGQQLTVPGASGETSLQADAAYVMRRGDSLYRISLIFGVSVDDLLAANNLSSPNAVYPGLVLRIPAPGDSLTTADVSGATGAAGTGEQTHLVGTGETLAQIAIQYDVTVDGLIAANGLSSADEIYPGQVLTIPDPGATARAAPAETAVTHLVSSGETLSEIAARYGVTVHSLAVANDIVNTASIIPGTLLSIPSAQAGSNSVSYASVGEGLCTDVEVERSGTGYFSRPVRGYVVTQLFHSGHPGIDLGADTGTPVYAADSGTVVFSGWNPSGYGNLVVLDHGNGWRTYYAHLSAIAVGCGEWVPRGTIVGEVGSTGNSTGPHLHFEMLRFGVAVNPAGYIRF